MPLYPDNQAANGGDGERRCKHDLMTAAEKPSEHRPVVGAMICTNESDRARIELELADEHCHVHDRQHVGVLAVLVGVNRAREDDLGDERMSVPQTPTRKDVAAPRARTAPTFSVRSRSMSCESLFRKR